jgi:hypothetical protein
MIYQHVSTCVHSGFFVGFVLLNHRTVLDHVFVFIFWTFYVPPLSSSYLQTFLRSSIIPLCSLYHSTVSILKRNLIMVEHKMSKRKRQTRDLKQYDDWAIRTLQKNRSERKCWRVGISSSKEVFTGCAGKSNKLLGLSTGCKWLLSVQRTSCCLYIQGNM